MNNLKLLSKCCHKAWWPLKNRMSMRFYLILTLFPLAYQIYLWCLQVANKGHFPAVLAINCAWFSPVSLVSVLVSSFWPHDLSSHDGENKAFGALLLLRSNEDSLWCLTDGFWVGLFLISQGELLWTKVSTGLQVIPPVSVLSIAHMIRDCNDAEKGLCKNTAPFSLLPAMAETQYIIISRSITPVARLFDLLERI